MKAAAGDCVVNKITIRFSSFESLETTLRNFSCLTTGDSIMVAYNNQKYYIDIIETKPSNAISIIETDCEVDFAPPLYYKEPEKPVAKVPSGKALTAGYIVCFGPVRNPTDSSLPVAELINAVCSQRPPVSMNLGQLVANKSLDSLMPELG
ncbi:hypothetical protein Vadar_010258 [Vaccinium darrowii]|uniref:Uncharacterized protein n=1 Tax=Vaccinium darrowii TaxID=229202 RepID=A0ACB7ZB76_9ERIC|nr:hypothetical protein Vadar_010258 [Vaccinium darrowii]